MSSAVSEASVLALNPAQAKRPSLSPGQSREAAAPFSMLLDDPAPASEQRSAARSDRPGPTRKSKDSPQPARSEPAAAPAERPAAASPSPEPKGAEATVTAPASDNSPAATQPVASAVALEPAADFLPGQSSETNDAPTDFAAAGPLPQAAPHNPQPAEIVPDLQPAAEGEIAAVLPDEAIVQAPKPAAPQIAGPLQGGEETEQHPPVLPAQPMPVRKPAGDAQTAVPEGESQAAADGETRAPQALQAEERTAPLPAKPEAAARPRAEFDKPAFDPAAADDLLAKPVVDSAVQTAASAQAAQQAAAQGASTASQPQSPVHQAAVPVAGLAVEIAAQARAGKNRFEIRLDPPELGRIDVRLDVDREGNVTSRLVVERAETLDLLRRDAQQIERALNQAGLKTGENALQFSLRDQGQAQHGDRGQDEGEAARVIVADDDPAANETVRGYGRLLGLGGGLDIRV